MASIGILLIALAFGYILCYLGKREEKALRVVGLTLGIFIIVAASLILLKKLVCYVPVSGKCPFTGKMFTPKQMHMPRRMEQMEPRRMEQQQMEQQK